jgi:hypothetical protein
MFRRTILIVVPPILILTIGGIGVFAARAQSSSPRNPPLVPIEDAYIALVQPNTPFGVADPDYLFTAASHSPSGPCITTRQTLVKFDVSALSGDVISVSLVLQFTMSSFPGGVTIAGLWPVADAWNELTVTWNTRPISSGSPLSTKSSPMPPDGQPLVFPNTAAMVTYVNSQRPPNGGDGVVSFITGFVDCPVLTAPDWRNTSKESPLNLPPLLNLEIAGPPTSIELATIESSATRAPSWPQVVLWLALVTTALCIGWLSLRRRARLSSRRF